MNSYDMGTRIGFRLIIAEPDAERQELTVHGRITHRSTVLSPTQVTMALLEIEQLVNEKLPHLRLHISAE